MDMTGIKCERVCILTSLIFSGMVKDSDKCQVGVMVVMKTFTLHHGSLNDEMKYQNSDWCLKPS